VTGLAESCRIADKKLVGLATGDDDRLVRRTAAIAVARLNRHDHYRQLLAALGPAGCANRVHAIAAAAHALNERSLTDSRNLVALCRSRLSPLLWLRILCRLLQIRLASGFVKFVYIVPLCAIGAATFTALVRWLPAMWYYTWTQPLPPAQWKPPPTPPVAIPNYSQIVEGIFQALCGGIGWGITISIAIGAVWILLLRGSPGRSPRRRIATVAGGLVGGAAGGCILNFLILPVYKPESHKDGGWVWDGEVQPPIALLDRFIVTFKTTRAPLIYPIYGIFLGIGCGWTAESLRSGRGGERWDAIIARRQESERAEDRTLHWGDVIELTSMSVRRAWRILVCMIVAAVILCWVVRTSRFSNQWTTTMRNLCDAGTIVAGGTGCVVAMACGFMLIRVGFRIDPHDD
jgi:hypothetical protein